MGTYIYASCMRVRRGAGRGFPIVVRPRLRTYAQPADTDVPSTGVPSALTVAPTVVPTAECAYLLRLLLCLLAERTYLPHLR